MSLILKLICLRLDSGTNFKKDVLFRTDRKRLLRAHELDFVFSRPPPMVGSSDLGAEERKQVDILSECEAFF